MIAERRIGPRGLLLREAGPPEDPAPLLLVHGAWHGAWCWEAWQDRLAAAGRRSVAISLRGHHGSDPVPDDAFVALSPEEYAEDVAEAATTIGTPPVLLGHSMGGTIAMLAATRLPLAALVLLAPGTPAGLTPVTERDFPADAPVRLDPEAARRALFHDAEPEIITAALARFSPESPGVLNRTGRAGVAVDPAAIGCPTLVVSAGEDRIMRHGRAIAGFLSADHVTAAACGHDLMLERRGPVALALILAWLEAALS